MQNLILFFIDLERKKGWGSRDNPLYDPFWHGKLFKGGVAAAHNYYSSAKQGEASKRKTVEDELKEEILGMSNVRNYRDYLNNILRFSKPINTKTSSNNG